MLTGVTLQSITNLDVLERTVNANGNDSVIRLKILCAFLEALQAPVPVLHCGIYRLSALF